MAATDHLGPQFYSGHIRMSAIPSPTQPVDPQRIAGIAAHLAGGGSVPPLEMQAGRLFNGNHRYAAMAASGRKTARVVVEGSKPAGMVYSRRISEREFEDQAGYTHEEDL